MSAFNELNDLFGKSEARVNRMVKATELLIAHTPDMIDSTIPGDPGPHVICKFPCPEPEDRDLYDLFVTAGQQALIGYLGADYFDPQLRTAIQFTEAADVT